MEALGALSGPTGGSSNLLSLPAPCCWDDEDEESLGLEGIKPKSSPIPRRRSSVSDDDDSSLPPPSSSRRVSFADAFGLSLVSVKQFDAWVVTGPPDPLESELSDAKEYYVVPLFALPQNGEELDLRVHQQMIELENLELLHGTTTLRGIVRVLNLSYDKMVYVRTSLDSWKSHFDLLAEYVSGSHDGTMDQFSFKLTLVPPFGDEGARVDFCLRYETSLGMFWANNNGQNYALVCYEKTKGKAQNERENRRKSCLKASSSSDLTATNNEEFPDILLNSGQSTGLKSQNTTSEELQKESKELLEETNRNRSERNRRKAARLAKVKEHFAQRREENQGTKTEEGEATEERDQEHASVLQKKPCSLSQQTTAGPPTCNQILSPPPAECLGSTECSEDSTHIFGPQAVEQHVRDTMIQSETNLSTARANTSVEDPDDLSDQPASVSQPPPGCQSSDLSTRKDVERAWKTFEMDARQRIKSLAQSPTTDEDAKTHKGKPALGEKVGLKTSKPLPQMFSHSYAFGTIVAPLYHQVFKNMETERKDFIQRAFQVDRTFRELEDESIKAVRPESDRASMIQSTETRSEPCASTEQTERVITTAQNSADTMSPPKKPSSDQIQEAETSNSYQNDYASDIIKYSKDNTFNKVTQNEEDFTNTQSHIKVENLTSQIYSRFPEEPQTFCNVCFEKPQNDFSASPTQSQQQIPSILCEGPAEPDSQDLLSGRSTENSNFTSYTFPEDPEMDQAPRITMASSDDKMEADYSNMRSNNEKPKLTEPHLEPENTQINTSSASENCQINETKEQIIVTFSTQISRPESFRIVDANEFDEEHNNTSVTEEPKDVQKEELNEQFICHISERLVEEEKGNQVLQMEKQEVEEDQRKQEHESTEEQEVKERGISNIEDELKYIDDEEDIDLDAVETENTANQESPDKTTEEKELVVNSTIAESLPQHDIELDDTEKQELIETSQGGDEDTSSGGEETGEEKCSSWQEQEDNEDNVCCESLQNHPRSDDENNMQENVEGQSKDLINRDVEKDVEDNTSTESLVDDEMELYLTCLRNSQQSVFREGITNGSYNKRPSLCRGRPLAMPSISESMDEDQTNGNLEDANTEATTELLVEGNEHVIGRNVLWWKEFLSYENMSRVMGYSVLLMAFLIVAYYYDFVACLALYLLTVYWLFRQREEEPMRSSWRKEREMQ